MLNARPQYVRKEAKVIAQAGLPSMITIATNMAGRGVDILMGGEPQGLAQMALEQLVFKDHLSGEAWVAADCHLKGLQSAAPNIANWNSCCEHLGLERALLSSILVVGRRRRLGPGI